MNRFMKNYDEEPEDFEEDYRNLINQQNALEGFHLHLLEKKVIDKILYKSIKICEKNIFWNFYTIQTKLNMIKKTYDYLIDLLKIEE